MDKREKNKWYMYKSIEELLAKQKPVVERVSVFAETLEEFSKKLIEISDIDNKYQRISEGATANKEIAEDALISVMVKTASSLYIFARKTGNESLKPLSKTSSSALKKARDADLQQRAKALYEAAKANLANLDKYGFDQATLDELETRIKDFESSSDSKENKFAESKNARQELGDLFDEANEFVSEDFDTMIELIREDAPTFYGDYQEARLVKDI